MTEPTEQARNELSAEALAEWCTAQSRRTRPCGDDYTQNRVRLRRIAALLRAGARCYEFAGSREPGPYRDKVCAEWEAAHE